MACWFWTDGARLKPKPRNKKRNTSECGPAERKEGNSPVISLRLTSRGTSLSISWASGRVAGCIYKAGSPEIPILFSRLPLPISDSWSNSPPMCATHSSKVTRWWWSASIPRGESRRFWSNPKLGLHPRLALKMEKCPNLAMSIWCPARWLKAGRFHLLGLR